VRAYAHGVVERSLFEAGEQAGLSDAIAWLKELRFAAEDLAYLASLRLPTSADRSPSLREVHHLLARLLFVLPSGFSLVAAWSAWRQWHGKLAATFHLRRRLKAG